VKIQVQFFWTVTRCSVAVGYRRFRGACCLHLHFILKLEAASYTETSVSYRNTTPRHNSEALDSII